MKYLFNLTLGCLTGAMIFNPVFGAEPMCTSDGNHCAVVEWDTMNGANIYLFGLLMPKYIYEPIMCNYLLQNNINLTNFTASSTLLSVTTTPIFYYQQQITDNTSCAEVDNSFVFMLLCNSIYTPDVPIIEYNFQGFCTGTPPFST